MQGKRRKSGENTDPVEGGELSDGDIGRVSFFCLVAVGRLWAQFVTFHVQLDIVTFPLLPRTLHRPHSLHRIEVKSTLL